jgi:hypothetical protein
LHGFLFSNGRFRRRPVTEDDVIAFYEEVIGKPHLRYPDGLASAVSRPQQSAFGEEAYPSLSLKAAALMHSLAENQPFIDGNKRIAWPICAASPCTFRVLTDLRIRAHSIAGGSLVSRHSDTLTSTNSILRTRAVPS